MKYIEIESTKAHLEARSQDLQGLKTKIGSLETEQKEKEIGTEKLSGSADRGQFQTESQ